MQRTSDELVIDESKPIYRNNEIIRLKEIGDEQIAATRSVWLSEKSSDCCVEKSSYGDNDDNDDNDDDDNVDNDDNINVPTKRLTNNCSTTKERRIHAVSPMQYQNGRFLSSLLHEAKISSSNNLLSNNNQNYGVDQEADAKLQQMINNYQAQVLQQQRSTFTDHEIIRSFPEPPSLSASSVQQKMPPMSHSQPCLINITERKKDNNCRVGESAPPMYTSLEQSDIRENLSLKSKLLSTQKCLKALQDENASLKQQCEFHKKKTNRLQQLESAYEAIEKEYESLTMQNERQDNLEKAMRAKMENQISRLSTENDILRERVDELTQRLQVDPQSDQLNKLNLILNEMIPQNKELLACKERQKRDIQALEITLKEQRNHIQILEKALSNAQEKVWKKEKEVEELSGNTERILSLQRAVEKSLMDKQKREEEWSRERAQLEMENAQLKMQLAKESMSVGVKKGAGARSPDNEEVVAKLKKTLHTKEDKITSLEKNIIELEAKFHEEMQRNKMAISTQSDSLSGKLKKMEEEKSEKDRKIAELTEEKEKLIEKLEDERKNSDNRISCMEREIERIRNERRLREDMARMEQMRLKIADRRCFTTDRTRNRFNSHDRTSSGSKASICQNHARANSASALLRSDLQFPIVNASSSLNESPLDLSSSSSLSKSTLPQNALCNNDSNKSDSIPDGLCDGSRCSRQTPIRSHYDIDFSDSEGIFSRFTRYTGHVAAHRNGKRTKENALKSQEEVWDV